MKHEKKEKEISQRHTAQADGWIRRKEGRMKEFRSLADWRMNGVEGKSGTAKADDDVVE